MTYISGMEMTTRMIADKLGISQKRVREIAKNMKIKPSWIGPTMVFSPKQYLKIKDRNTDVGRPRTKCG